MDINVINNKLEDICTDVLVIPVLENQVNVPFEDFLIYAKDISDFNAKYGNSKHSNIE